MDVDLSLNLAHGIGAVMKTQALPVRLGGKPLGIDLGKMVRGDSLSIVFHLQQDLLIVIPGAYGQFRGGLPIQTLQSLARVSRIEKGSLCRGDPQQPFLT